ncbi:MAG: FAD:protein FMN transferase [Clostridia bacterium]|nr:FAD:protein FMN transferase [Clostridia bacterium]
MKMKRIALAAALLCSVFIFAHAQAILQGYKGKTRVTMGAFGTVSTLCLFDDYDQPGAITRYDNVWAEIKRLLEQMDQLLSVSIETSEIARFNALPSGGEMEISPLTAQVFMLAREMHDRTRGYFDPTVYPLVDLWGFSPRFINAQKPAMPYDREWQDGARALPEQKYIDGFLSLVNMDGIVLDGDAQSGFRLRKETPSVVIDGETYHAQIDLGGIAKGYAADRVAELLAGEGYAYGYFSCGSSSLRLMKNASFAARESGDPAFSLQVRIPRETENNREAYAYIRVMDQSLSSSGDYDNNYIAGGNLCSHIISPFTGYPLNYTEGGVQGGVSTVTLLSGSAVEDDALTTALCLMGPQGAIDYINKNLREHSVALVLYRADQNTYEVVTNIGENGLEILDPAYRLASRLDESGNIVYTGELFRESL